MRSAQDSCAVVPEVEAVGSHARLPPDLTVFGGGEPTEELSFHFTLAHYQQVTAYFPVFIGEAPVRESVLRQLHHGSLDIEPLVSDFVSWERAPDVHGRLFTPERDHLGGIVFDWRDAT